MNILKVIIDIYVSMIVAYKTEFSYLNEYNKES